MTRLGPQALYVAMFTIAFLTLPDQLERKVAPETLSLPRGAEASQAPIWSKRCAGQGLGMIAHQADGGPWKVACTGPAARR